MAKLIRCFNGITWWSDNIKLSPVVREWRDYDVEYYIVHGKVILSRINGQELNKLKKITDDEISRVVGLIQEKIILGFSLSIVEEAKGFSDGDICKDGYIIYMA